MYGTVARMKAKSGHEDALLELQREELQLAEADQIGFLYVYKLDGSENEYIMVVGFESKEAYKTNAESPEQHERYLRYMEHMDGDPEWNDGEIILAHA